MTDQAASADQQEQASPSLSSSSAVLPSQSPAAAPIPVREDQVRSSSAASKRDFLERKGLTAEEIDEAVRRVPETTVPLAAPAMAAAALPSSSPVPQAALQTTLQHLQPSQQYAGQAHQHGGAMGPHPGMQMVPAAAQQPLRWSQVALGAGFFAAGAYAVKQLLWPYVWDAYEGWRERQGGMPRVRAPPRPKQPNREELSAEVSRAVAEAIQAQTAELRTSVEAIRELAQSLEAQRRQAQEEAQARAEAAAAAPAAPLGDSVTVIELRQELKALAATLQETIAASPAKSRPAGGNREGSTTEQELSEIKGLLAAFLRSPETTRASGAAPAHDFGSPLSVKSDAGTGSAPHAPLEEPATTLVSAFAQPITHAKQAGSPVVGDAATPAKEGGSTRADGQSLPRPDSATSLASSAPSQPPHPPSYMEVLEMLEKGITPPGIRTDIDDKAPNPEQPPPQPRLKPRPKPWEKKGAAAATGSGGSFFANGNAESPASSAAPSAAGSQRGTEGLVDSFGGTPGIVRSASGGSLGSSSRGGQPVAHQPVEQQSFDGAARAALGTCAAPTGELVRGKGEEPAAVEGASGAASSEASTDGRKGRRPGVQAAAGESIAIPAHPTTTAEPASAKDAVGPSSTAGTADSSEPGVVPAGASYKEALLGGDGGAPAEQQAQQQPQPATKPANSAGAAGVVSTPPGSHHGVFRTPPARATSIYEAAAGPSSPGLIAGRFSPIRSSGTLPEPAVNGFALHDGELATEPQAAATAPAPSDEPRLSASSLPPQPPQLSAQQAPPNAALPPTFPAYSLGGSFHQHFSSPAASSAPWRAGREALQAAGDSSTAAPAATAAAPADLSVPSAAAPGIQGGEVVGTGRDSSFGSIARPLASGWRPPPIPVPTLLGASGRAESRGSVHSLGEDFSSAV
ncbi:hypothetical protein N2152v2_005752 [Parachlorella kessleri]